MSITNIVIEQDRALIGVDTLGGFMDQAASLMSEGERQDRHVCKFSLLPQISSAMTSRGDAWMTALVRQQLDLSLARSFDDAAHMMPAFLTAAYDQVMAIRKQQHSIDQFYGAEVVLVGWSPTAKRFEGMRWYRYPTDAAFIPKRLEKMGLFPEIDRIEAVEVPDTPAKMEAVARRQVAWARRDGKQYPCGGKLLMVELTRDAVNVRTIADLEQPEAIA